MAEQSANLTTSATSVPALLNISPSVLVYPSPYDRILTQQITIQNPTSHHFAFKVKTTAPKRYIVKPNNGFIAPNDSVHVLVSLLPLNNEIPKEKDRFQIQSVDLSEDFDPKSFDSKDLWKSINDTQIAKQRLKVKFEIPAEKPRTTTSASTTPISTSTTTNASATSAPLSQVSAPEPQRIVQTHKPSEKNETVEDLQEKLKKALSDNKELHQKYEALQAQNKRLLTERSSIIDLKLIILSILFLIIGYLLGNMGDSNQGGDVGNNGA